MMHFYVYIQNWGNTISTSMYNSYTDNEFMMNRYVTQINNILTRGMYKTDRTLDCIFEVDVKSEDELISQVQLLQRASLFSKDNKLYALHGHVNEQTCVYVNKVIYNNFNEKFIVYGELTKLRADLYRMSSSTMMDAIWRYLNHQYSDIVIMMLMGIHNQYVTLVNMRNSSYEVWDVVDVAEELLRFITIDIMKIVMFYDEIPFSIYDDGDLPFY